VTYRAVEPAEALAEACPTCQAKPGDPCVYAADLLTTGPDKQFIHERGEPLPEGDFHNARKGIAKARVAEAKEAWRAAHPERRFMYATAFGRPARRGSSPVMETVVRDERIARLYRGGAGIPAIADMEDVTRATVYNALARREVPLRAADRGDDES
jgi:hypothetical protein